MDQDKVLLLDNAVDRLKLNTCKEKVIDITIITQTQRNIQFHVSLAILFHQVLQNTINIILDHAVLSAFFSQTQITYYLHVNTTVILEYFGANNESNQLTRTGNNFSIYTFNSQLMYMRFLQPDFKKVIRATLHQPRYNISLGDALLVPVLQSQFSPTVLQTAQSIQKINIALYLHRFDENIQYAVIQEDETIYFQNSLRSFQTNNITIYTYVDITLINVLQGMQKGFYHMFVALQGMICLLKQNENRAGCSYYIIQLKNSDIYNNINNQNAIGVPLVIIESLSPFVISFSMDKYYNQNNENVIHENKCIYYNIMPADLFLNNVVQIQFKTMFSQVYMSIQSQLPFNQQHQFIINSNQNNYFYTNAQFSENVAKYYVLKVSSNNVISTSIYIGFGYYIPREEQHDVKYDNINFQSTQIIFTLGKALTQTIHINIVPSSSIYTNITFTMQLSFYQENIISLDKNTNITVSSGSNYISFKLNRLYYYIYNNNIFYPIYGLYYIEIDNPYCKKYYNYTLSTESCYEISQINVLCVQQINSIQAQVVSHTIWKLSNESLFSGPIYNNNPVYIELPTTINGIYYLKTDNVDDFIYYQGKAICDLNALNDCNEITWDQYNMSSKIINLTISIHPDDLVQNAQFKVQVIKIQQLDYDSKLIVDGLNKSYYVYNASHYPIDGCGQMPIINVSQIVNGCIIISKTIYPLIEMNSCNQNSAEQLTIIDRPQVIQNYEVYKQNYLFYIKVLTDYGEIEINNLQLCQYAQIIEIPDCLRYQRIFIEIPSNITKEVLVATNIDVFYYIINVRTNQVVEILESFYSHTFLRGGEKYILQLICSSDNVYQIGLKLQLQSDNVYQFNQSINLDVSPGDIYIINPKYNFVIAKMNKQNIPIQLSYTGIDFDQIQSDINIILNSEERIFVKFGAIMSIKLVQLSNLYPILRCDEIMINYQNNTIQFPSVYTYLSVGQYNPKYVTNTLLFQLFVDHAIYYNGTNTSIEMGQTIFDNNVIWLEVLVDNQLLYNISKTRTGQKEYQQFNTQKQKSLLLDHQSFIIFIIMLVTFLVLIIFIIALNVINMQLGKKIKQEQHQIIQQLNKKDQNVLVSMNND